jgi:hypothetical protein
MALTCAALVLATATACGDDEAGDGAGGPFIGTWSTTTGKRSIINCLLKATTENLAITYTVEKGDGADVTIVSSLAADCKLKANVVGTRATLIEDQTCVHKEGANEDTYRYATTSVFDLTNGATVKLQATFTRADGALECGYTEEATITKR